LGFIAFYPFTVPLYHVLFADLDVVGRCLYFGHWQEVLMEYPTEDRAVVVVLDLYGPVSVKILLIEGLGYLSQYHRVHLGLLTVDQYGYGIVQVEVLWIVGQQ